MILLVVLIWIGPLIRCKGEDTFGIDFSIIATYPQFTLVVSSQVEDVSASQWSLRKILNADMNK
jgi:hypothetical protein